MNNDMVMIVDDSLTVRMDLLEAFATEDMKAIGCDTLGAARVALTKNPIGLVVLDMLLPDGNGVDLIREIRAMPARSGIPILVLSTEAEVRDRIHGLMTGSDDYVGKPYDREYVVARARELLGNRDEDRTRPTEYTTILVIDDSPTFREELSRALEEHGYRVISAASGEEGLRKAAASRPAAIIVDGMLPGIDGATVVRKLRLDAALRQIPCVMLTGSTRDRSAELNALDAGADAFVRKEDDMELVLARVAAVLRAGADSNRETTSLLGPKKILAVDDSITYLEELTLTLRGEGYDVIPARSGEEALEMLAAQPVDCILLDRLMPGLDGTETCRRIKASTGTRDIPLIMLTASEDRAAMIEGLSTGADDYVLKSSEQEVLKARVRAQLRRKQMEDESRRIRLQLLRKELEASEARSAKELAETRARLVEQLENKNRELENYANEIRRAEEKFRALAETATDAIVSADQSGNIIYANPSVRHMFGYSAVELVGKSLTCLIPERLREAHRVEFQRYLGGGAAQLVGKGIVELAGRRKDGAEFPLEFTLAEWRAEGERHFTAIIRDVSARHEAQRCIRELNADLEQRAAALAGANKELEAFSYSVSHDLRAPLRAIDGFSRILLADYSAALGVTGRDYLERVCDANKRMVELTDDLLTLSRVARTEPNHEEVDLSALVQDVADALRKQESTRRVQFTLAPGLKVQGDPRLLRIAIENLLGNAWKFTGRRLEAQIEFGVQAQNGKSIFFVRDNGAGFDMSYADKLFTAFQRLHTPEEFPGTGIGLATVQRIVRKHAGRIWAEALAGKGATFYFTLSLALIPHSHGAGSG
jgi:PAS domain S-box-containing protein